MSFILFFPLTRFGRFTLHYVRPIPPLHPRHPLHPFILFIIFIPFIIVIPSIMTTSINITLFIIILWAGGSVGWAHFIMIGRN